MFEPRRFVYVIYAGVLACLLACNMATTPRDPATSIPTLVAVEASATPQIVASATPTAVPPTQRPPVVLPPTAVPPATVAAPQQPDPNLCYFYPYGLNGSTITLYSGPGEGNPLGATISAQEFIVALSQAGSWIRIRNIAGQEGWIQAERGMLGNSCGSLPQQPAPTECRATANADTTVLVQPQYGSQPFMMTLIASASVRVVARSSGFLGFDPGVNWIPANITGTARLRWIAPGDTISLSGDCDSLQQIPAPVAECRATANADTTVLAQPQYGSEPFVMKMIASSSVAVVARSNGFLGFDPGVNWVPADVTGTARLRWIAPGDTISLSGNCDSLPNLG